MGRAPLCNVAPNLWNKLWNSKKLECHKVLWWSILSNDLPVRAILSKRMVIDEISCPFCGNGDETMEHLFLYWDLASHLWRSSPWGVMHVVESGARMWDWIMDPVCSSLTRLMVLWVGLPRQRIGSKSTVMLESEWKPCVRW
ncbi:uncharacterized protein LOC115696472 [Cannabis sativa]|uniref:uncharacterized protein LOC115696472 n=1 Tax=Cannabis sativa TaxID=3483 RepID=UPI0029C9EB18|nr:uncharacterized protein LOC115696472 [Cannabis sativa]